MIKFEKKCFYCDTPNGQYSVYLLRKAYKPAGKPYRWRNIGYCCEHCHDIKNKSICIEYNLTDIYNCELCNNLVSHNVVSFCMNPKQNFKILCWNCQQK